MSAKSKETMLLAKLGWKSCDGRHFQQLAILSRTPETLDTMCTLWWKEDVYFGGDFKSVFGTRF